MFKRLVIEIIVGISDFPGGICPPTYSFTG